MRHRLLLALSLVAAPLAFGCSAAGAKDGASDLGGSDDNDGGAGRDGFNPNNDGGLGGLDPDSHAPLDPKADNDGDGYLYADDCDDTNKLINPGAFDVVGDKVDNDCNGKVDDVPNCDVSLALDTGNPMDFAKSLGLCNATTAGATGKNKIWGVISATLKTVDGTQDPLPAQYGLEAAWGSAVRPKDGGTIAVLSTGSARTPGQAGYIKPLVLDVGSTGTGHENDPPPGWPKNSPGCADPTSPKVNDSVGLTLQIRVPTNANAFSYDFDFYTSEYHTYVCTEFNDSYIALLKTSIVPPLDPKNNGNISFDSKGGPINVNSGWFQVCAPFNLGDGVHNYTCPLGRGELAGTGFDGDDDPADPPAQDGATSWLETKAGVVPGETITIQFVIWNTGDHILQSTVLLDNFKWDATPTTGPSTDRPK
jgi:hypothetical protein